MSSKKGPRSDWYECNSCGAVFLVKDTIKHSKHCGAEWIDTAEEPYGYFKNGVLHALLQDHTEASEVKLTTAAKRRLAFLSPATMQLAGLSIGDPIVVDGGVVCLTAWPMAKMAAAAISVASGSCLFDAVSKPPGSLVCLQPMAWQLACTAAESVHFIVSTALQSWNTTPSFDSGHFTRYVHNTLVDRYVSIGNHLKIHYYGLPLMLQIQSVSPTCKPKEAPCQTASDSENITDALCSLDLSSVADTPTRPEPVTPVNRNSRCGAKQSSASPSLADDMNLVSASMGLPKCSVSDSKFYRITDKTKVVVDACSSTDLTSSAMSKPTSMPHVTFSMIGGLDRQVDMLRDLVQLPLEHPALFKKYGLVLPKGVLIYGASGTGKTMLAHAVATEVKATFINLNGPEIWSKYFGETESKLNSLFKEAVDKSPSIIFIDELDALCPRRERSQSETEKRVLATLLLLIDSIEHYPDRRIIILGATSKPDVIDPALRRPGRFDREVEITIPNADGRLLILTKLLASVVHDLSQSELAQIADTTHGYVGADLVALCQEAGMRAIKRDAREKGASGEGHSSAISVHDFTVAMAAVQPSAMREVVADVPKVRWSDIGGQAALKESLRQAVEWPLKHKDAFLRLGVKAPRGVLLYGPPGCSKTMFAKALASESGLNFIPIKGPELFSKWVGESEKAVREVFRKARAAAPSIVFFDEIDALASERGSSSGSSGVGDRVLAQLLTEMDGVEALADVIVVAATNRPDMIDKALLRPGRLDRIVYVPLPDAETRRGIVTICTSRIPLTDDFDVDRLVERTAGYSGAEITAVCNEAGLAAMKENVQATCVEMRHFLAALDMVRPRTSPEAVRQYETYARATSGDGGARH